MRVFFRVGILNLMKVMFNLHNAIRLFAQTCHFPFSTKIQFTLILLLSLILIMIFIKIRHLTRTNFLFFIYMPAVCKINLEDITSESSIICVTENHLDGKILDNYIIIDGFQRSSWS